MPDAHPDVETFLNTYQQALREFDLERLGTLYSDAFLFAGPAGAMPVTRSDFLRVVPRKRESFTTLGVTSSRVRRFEAARLTEHYVIVKTVWELEFAPERAHAALEIAATYVLQRHQDSFRVVLQLDHQDLAKAVLDSVGG